MRPPVPDRRLRPNSGKQDLGPASRRKHTARGDTVKLLAEFIRAVFAAVIFVAAGVGSLVTPVTHASAAQDEPIIFLGDANYAPYEFLVNGKPVGANVDLITAIGKALGQRVEIRLMKWSDAQAKVLSGVGHALTFMSRDPERLRDYDFSEPTFFPAFFFFTTTELAAKFGVGSLSKVRIGVVQGGFPEAYMRQNHPEAELVRIKSELDGFSKLLSAVIDAVATSKLTGFHILDKYEISGIEAVGEPFAVKAAGIAVPKGNPELVRRLDEGLRTLKQNGELDAILVKWMGDLSVTDAGLGIPVHWIVASFAVFVTIAALLLWSIAGSRAAGTPDAELLAQGFRARYLIAGFGGIIAMMVLLEGYSISQTTALATLPQNLYRHPFAVTNAILDAHADIISIDRTLQDGVMATNPAELESAVDEIARYDRSALRHFDVVFDRFLGGKSRVVVARKSFLEWRSLGREAIDLMRNGRRQEAAAVVEGLNSTHLADLKEKMLALIAFARGKAALFVANSRKQHATYTSTMYVLVFATIVLGAVISVAIVLAVKRRGQELHASASRSRDLAEQLEQRVHERTAELAAANEELEAFAYSVSHDLRAPLRGLDGFSRILLRDHAGSLDDKARHYLDRIRAASQKMGRLIDDILALSRSSRGDFTRQTLDLSEMARAICERLASAEPERRVTVDIAEGLEAEGDKTLVSTMLENLLDNAWKFTAKTDRPKIAFGADIRGGRRVFFVRDNGAGFDMAYADKLFTPFQRLHGEGEFEGTGVGLATVARIIRRHGGAVWGEAEVDRGATFSFTFSR